MTKDILIYETGSGGDFFIQNNDLVLVESLFSQVYICLFGGNTEASTKGNELDTEIRNDWWGNFLYSENIEKQFNSETERTLRTSPLNSSGRIQIEKAIQNDLTFLKKVCDISVFVSIISTNKTGLEIKLKRPNNQEDKILQIIWDNAKNEIISNQVI